MKKSDLVSQIEEDILIACIGQQVNRLEGRLFIINRVIEAAVKLGMLAPDRDSRMSYWEGDYTWDKE